MESISSDHSDQELNQRKSIIANETSNSPSTSGYQSERHEDNHSHSGSSTEIAKLYTSNLQDTESNEHTQEAEEENEDEDDTTVYCDADMFDIENIRGVITEQKDRLMRNASRKTEEAGLLVRRAIDATQAWAVCHFNHLPRWLQDNEFLHRGHRPQLESFKVCFQSIFRMHSETGNIWTHLIGCLILILIAIYAFFTWPEHMQWPDKLVFSVFFLGAILCLGFSFLFHTVSCHSLAIGKLFSKFDYCGICLLINGSFVPCIYYLFYCDYMMKLFYLVAVFILFLFSVVVSLWDKFSEPNYRPIRALVFLVFGCSGVIPTIHWFFYVDWPIEDSMKIAIIYLVLMGVLYITGALLYAGRIPERFFPGKCDYWFQSHQIFHILVIIAAIMHYQGIHEMANYRLSGGGNCPQEGR